VSDLPDSRSSHTRLTEVGENELLTVNYSDCYGGQERYIELLAGGLAFRGWRLRFVGGPEQLLCNFEGTVHSKGECSSASDVVLLNGNRALYRGAMTFFNSDMLLYVQHSSFSDRQGGRIKRVVRSILMRLALRRVDGVIRVCESALPNSVFRTGAVVTVHNGVNLAEFPCKTDWIARSTRLRLLMVGAVNPNKNQEMAIEALVDLPGAELTVVGDGPALERLKAQAAELGVADRVIWAGRHEDTAHFYRNADVYLMLSRFEAMPFVVLESMASGTPVVAVRVGGVPEVITDGVDGVLLRDNRVATLVAALKGIAATPQRLREMGCNARSTVEKRFTAEHMVEGFLRVVDEVRRRKGLGQPQ